MMPLEVVLFEPTGRMGRSDFWVRGVLFIFALGIIGHAVTVPLFVAGSLWTILAFALSVMLYCVLTWMYLSVVSKRLHDIGHSGWWVLLGLFPILAFCLLVYCGTVPGDPNENTHGPAEFDPSAITDR